MIHLNYITTVDTARWHATPVVLQSGPFYTHALCACTLLANTFVALRNR